jgi:Caspase domain
MANQACISIGIDRYQSLQSLGYGMADAVAIEHFFVDAAGWDRSQCLLLTDTSAKMQDRSTYPDRETIDRWLQQWCWDKLKAGDLLIFFFSGYGVSNGTEDYLVPIDGNPDDLANTCISLRQIYQQLHETGASVLVFLDANRSSNMSAGSGIGNVTAKLAQEYQIPTFLSCQSHEFSHEAAGLGHGLFTAALLEALNYHPDLNLETLEAYVTSRLAELGEHHWKPIQTPVALIPSTISIYRPIFSATTQSAVSAAPDLAYSPPTQPQLAREDNFYYQPPTLQSVSAAIPPTGAIVKIRELDPPDRGLSNWAKVSALVFLLIGAGGGIFAFQQSKLSPNTEELPLVSPGNNSSTNSSALSQAKLFVKPGDATSRYQAILAAQKIPTDDPAAAEVKQAIDTWSQEIYDIAKTYVSRDRKLAIDTAKMVPPQASIYSQVQTAMLEWKK